MEDKRGWREKNRLWLRVDVRERLGLGDESLLLWVCEFGGCGIGGIG